MRIDEQRLYRHEVMLLVALSWIVAVGCIVVTARRLGQVSALARDAAAAESIERASRERLLAKLPESSELGRVARDVLSAPTERAGVAELNAALSDIARELEVSAEVPKSATRVAFATGALAGIIELARRIPIEGAGALGIAGIAFGGGLVGGFVCNMLGRTAETRAKSCRRDWDRLTHCLERLLKGADVGVQDERQPVDPEPRAD